MQVRSQTVGSPTAPLKATASLAPTTGTHTTALTTPHHATTGCEIREPKLWFLYAAEEVAADTVHGGALSGGRDVRGTRGCTFRCGQGREREDVGHDFS